MSDRRAQAFDRAKEYLVGSGQEQMLEALPQNDIKHMRELADSLRDTDVLESKRTNKGGRRRAQTISLSDDYNPQIKLAVASSLAMNPSLDEDL